MSRNINISHSRTQSPYCNSGEFKKLTPAPQTTHWTPLRTTPTDHPKESTKFTFMGQQETYLLQLHDHNCMKNSCNFLFPIFIFS